jgi:hypothetical protein
MLLIRDQRRISAPRLQQLPRAREPTLRCFRLQILASLAGLRWAPVLLAILQTEDS